MKVIAEDGYTCDIQSIGDGDCSPIAIMRIVFTMVAIVSLGEIYSQAIRMVNGRIMMKMVGSSSTEAFSPLQQGDELFENPLLHTSDASIYTDAVINELKLLKDAENVLLFDSDNDGTVTMKNLKVHLFSLAFLRILFGNPCRIILLVSILITPAVIQARGINRTN